MIGLDNCKSVYDGFRLMKECLWWVWRNVKVFMMGLDKCKSVYDGFRQM
jgi:hypothetical protein